MIILRKIRFQEYARAEEILKIIKKLEPSEEVRILNVCGSHEHTICRWGLRSLLPKKIRLIPGPGCPVCVTSEEEIINVMNLAEAKDTVVVTYPDMLRVPTRRGRLSDFKDKVKGILSCHEALKVARAFPDKKVVFFSIGFETTAAPAASLFFMDLPENFFFLSSHKLTTSAMRATIRAGIHGFIAPGHVSATVGSSAWREFPEKHKVAVVVAGFTPEDVLLAVAVILFQLKEKSFKVENVYKGVVRKEGNVKAKRMMAEVFKVVDTKWRGMGVIENSGLDLKERFLERDIKHVIKWENVEEKEGPCICADIIFGRKLPTDCPLFGKKCVPGEPVGPCMVSPEGACRIWFSYGKW